MTDDVLFNQILRIVRDWTPARSDLSPEQISVVRHEMNEVGDRMQSELERAGVKTIGEAADNVMADLAKRSGNLQ